MGQVGDWEELFHLSSKAFATPGCFPEEGSVLCAEKWEKHSHREKRWE